MCKVEKQMQIQPKQQIPSFQAIHIQQGTFKTIKEASFFPKEAYIENPKELLIFYKKLKGLIKESKNNSMYNVVFKPQEQKVVIEDAKQQEQSGFTTTFENLFRVSTNDNTKQNHPIINILMKNLKKYKIKYFQKMQDNNQIIFKSYLDTVFQRIQQIVRNADYLASIQK